MVLFEESLTAWFRKFPQATVGSLWSSGQSNEVDVVSMLVGYVIGDYLIAWV